jgi:hypothetical protein
MVQEDSMARVKFQRAMELALAARCAYPDGREQIHELELDSWHPFVEGPIEGFVGSTGKKVLLSFRGSTVSPGEFTLLTWLDRAFSDWSANCDLNPQQFHSGIVQGCYLTLLRKAWLTIHGLLTDHGAKDKNLWITGHSLGGAMATIAGAMCRWEGSLNVAGVYTFGAPKVGDDKFAQNYPAELQRFENRNDIVPHLPPSGYAIQLLRVLSTDIEEAFERWFGPEFVNWKPTPVGELQYIDKKGRIDSDIEYQDRLVGIIKSLVFDPSQLLQDHWIDSYCAAIDALL